MKLEIIKRKLIVNTGVLLLGLILPALTHGQPPPPTGNGGLPDSPLAVPFDSHLAILLILAGIVFGVTIILQKNKIIKEHQLA